MVDPAYREGIPVDAEWLAEQLEDLGIRIVDLRWRSGFVDARGSPKTAAALHL